MKRWFEQRKPLMIVMGVVYVILALFIVSAFVKNKVDYVEQKQFGSPVVREETTDSIDGEAASSSPFAEGHTDEELNMTLDTRGIFEVLTSIAQGNISDIGGNLSVIFKHSSIYFAALKSFSIVYFAGCIVLLIMMKTDKEFQGVEHGSAGWAERGEEYAVLSRTDGFILAKDHYMPMLPNPPSGKNGNILVIRRFWFW